MGNRKVKYTFYILFLILVEIDDNSINSTSSAAIDKQKKEFEDKVIDPSTRRRISKVVQCIMQLK